MNTPRTTLLALLLVGALCSCSIDSFCKRTEQVAATTGQVLAWAGVPGELVNAAALQPVFAGICAFAENLGGLWDKMLGFFTSDQPATDEPRAPPAAEEKVQG